MPNFTNNLIGIGKICDAQCMVTLTATEVIVRDKTGNIIWQGFRETSGAWMWRFNIRPHSAATTTPYAATVTPHNLLQLIPPDNQLNEKPQPQY